MALLHRLLTGVPVLGLWFFQGGRQHALAPESIPQIPVPSFNDVNCVGYHGNNCPDGKGARYAAESSGIKARFFAINYNQPIPEFTHGKNVALLDWSLRRHELFSLITRLQSLIILDHHVTADQELSGFPNAVIDMQKSGAVLAWEYFHPGESIPPLLLHIQDYDLGRRALPGTLEINEVMQITGDSFAEMDTLVKRDIADVIAEGSVLLKSKQALFDRMAESAHIFTTDKGKKILAVNCSQVLRSDFGLYLSTKFSDCDAFLLYEELLSEHRIKFSLRTERQDLAVNVLAKKITLGGGGHLNAAGGTWNKDIYKLIKKLKRLV